MTMATADDTDDARADAERSARWLTENAGALESSNRYDAELDPPWWRGRLRRRVVGLGLLT